VSYGPGHSYHREWVYNRVDLESPRNVWARDMGDSKNRALISYYPDRLVWLLTASDSEETSPEPHRDRIVIRPYLQSDVRR
jgi:hypothetical protein